MDDLMRMQDQTEYEHSRWMRWVHDERGTVEVVGVLTDES